MHRLAFVLLPLAGLALPQPTTAGQSVVFFRRAPVVSVTSDFNGVTSAGSESSGPGVRGSLLVGLFKPKGTDQKLKAAGTGYGWGLTLGYRITHWLGLEGEFLYFEGDYERVSDVFLPGRASNEVNMASVDLSARVRASFPIWKLRPFTAGGVGFVDSDLYTKDASSGLFENSAGGQAPGWQVLAGFVFPTGKGWQTELGWRWIHLRQDFGIFSDGEVRLGGNMLYLAILGGY